jgi:lysophospholipase L1-like esterase
MAALLASGASLAQNTIQRLGAVGDSLTDEYAEETYGGYAFSWTQQLVMQRGINMGPTAAQAGMAWWGEPRRTGYQDNWARYSATTDQALSGGQASGVEQGVEQRGTSHAVVFIGGNDFSPGEGPYNQIYDGAPVDPDYVDSRLLNYRQLLQQLAPLGERVVLVNVLDFSFMPLVWAGHTVPEYRERVTRVIADFNQQLRALARERGIVYLDLFRLNKDLFGPNQDPTRRYILVGGRLIDLLGSGVDPSNGFVADTVHPHTVIQSIWANAIMTALSTVGGDIPLFTEREMLENVGMSYGGVDQLHFYLLPYRQYVANFACAADFNEDQMVTVQDLFDFLTAYFTGDWRADVDRSDDVGVGDIFEYLRLYFAGCSGE